MSTPAEEAPPDVVPAKSGNKIMPIILVANTLMIAGVLIFVMKRPSAQASAGGKEAAAAGEHAEKSEKHEKSGHGEEGEKGEKGEGKSGEHGEAEGEGPGPVLKLETFIVQIRAPEGDRYAHLTLELELGSEGDKKYFEARMPRIRDAAIGYLSDRTEDELRGSEGLGVVKEALLKKLNEIVPGNRIRALFITEFIIQ
jgi:flagellar FliL protein